MSAPLFLLLFLFHYKSALGFRFPFLPADLSALRFYLLSLSLKSLLGFRTDTCVFQMLSGIPTSSFWIVSRLSDFHFNNWTEDQFIIVVQDVIPDLIIFWFRPEGHFTDSFPSSICSKTPTQKGSSKNTVRLAFISPDYTPLFTMAAY